MMPGRSLPGNTSGRSMRAGRRAPLRARAPATAARAAGFASGCGEMVGQPLDQAHDDYAGSSRSAVVRGSSVTRGHCAAEFGQRRRRARSAQACPRCSGSPVGSASSAPPISACSSQRMTRAPEDGGGQGRGETGRARADDQHVAMRDSGAYSGPDRARSATRPRPAAARISGSYSASTRCGAT